MARAGPHSCKQYTVKLEDRDLLLCSLIFFYIFLGHCERSLLKLESKGSPFYVRIYFNFCFHCTFDYVPSTKKKKKQLNETKTENSI